MDSIYTDIIKGKISTYKIAEDNENIAILDIMPLKLGHTLVIPKKQCNIFTNMKKNEFISLMKFVFLISQSVNKAISCNRVGISILGFEIPHVHIHIIPINNENEMNFNNSRIKCNKHLFTLISNTIKYYYNDIVKK